MDLEANTEVKVRVGQFVDVSDCFTPETGVTLGAADEAELLKHNGVATVDISGNTWAAIASCDGWYDLTLTTTDTNTEGLLTVVVQDDSVCLPVHANFMVLAQAAWDSKYTAKDTGYMDVNVKAISEDTAAADNCEADYDGTGYVGGTIVKQADVTKIGGVAQSATDLKDLADTGYDPSTHKIQGVVLTDTCTTNTDVRGTDNAATEAKQDIIDTNVDSILEDTGTTLENRCIAIEADTGEIGTAGAGLTDLGGMSTGMKAEAQVEANDALIANNLDHLMKTATGSADMSTEVVDNTALSRVLANGDTSAFVPSTDSLQNIRDAQVTIDTVVDTLNNHLISPVYGLALIKNNLATVDGIVDSILVDTGTTLDNLIDAIKAMTDNLPSAVKKNTALNNFTFPMVLSSDHATAATGKTLTAERSIDGGAFAACANSASEISAGAYKINLATTDLNGNVILLKFAETDCDTRFILILTKP